MDENLAFKTPANITNEQAATIGVGILVSRFLDYGYAAALLINISDRYAWCN
jgi:hypothetical protein